MALMQQNYIISLNTQGLKSNRVYIESIIKNYQVVYLCEHWLLKAEEYLLKDMVESTHKLIFTPANKGASGRPFGGNCILIKHNTKHQVIHEDNRIIALHTILDGTPLLIIGVYLTAYHDQQSLSEYNDQLSIITSLLKQNSGEFEVMIIGDFNSFPADIYDMYPRVSLKRNPLSKSLKNFLITNNLKFLDVTDGEGPNITYRHPSLPNTSYIDHVAVLEDTSLDLQDCTTHSPEETNISDHTPISLIINSELEPSIDNTIEEIIPRTLRKWVWKNAAFIETYQSLLNEQFEDLEVPKTYTENHIFEVTDTLVETAFTAAEMIFPESKKKYSKRWWTPELSEAKMQLSLHFNNWRDSGFPKDGGIVHNRFLLARKIFRKRVKKAQNDETRKKYLLIDKLRNTEPRNFWTKMKFLRRSDTKRLYNVNNKQTAPEIANEFADHFSTLLNYPRIPTQIDPYVIEVPDDEDTPVFTSVDISKAIDALKLGKSTDPFGVGSEHIIYVDNLRFSNWLAGLYNYIPEVEETPLCLSSSKMIPLVKSLKKSLKSAGNYRGISIIPILTKILEYLILHRCPQLMTGHPLQFGFTQHSSSLHAEFIINETVKAYNKKGSCIYMCSLDAEKAFDSCNWDALFKKMIEEKKIPAKMVKIISSLYKNGTAQVHYENCISEMFKLSQGVRQGSILSPYLYNIYTEMLLNFVEEETKVGTSLYGVFSGIIMYADDIILLSPTVSGLQSLINKCTTYCNDLGVAINAGKTEFLSSGIPGNPNCYLMMDYTRVHPGKSLKHLGFLWNINHKRLLTAGIEHENIDARLSKFWTVIYGLINAGICYCAPHTRITLFRSIAVPTLTYGLELCNLGQTVKNKLDCEGRRALKALFNVSKYSKNYLHQLFYLNSVSTVIKKNKMNLCNRLMRNPTTKPILLHMLKEGRNNNFIGGLVDDNIDILDVLMNEKVTLEDNHHLPEEIRWQLEVCIKHWDLAQARNCFWRMLEEKIPVAEEDCA